MSAKMLQFVSVPPSDARQAGGGRARGTTSREIYGRFAAGAGRRAGRRCSQCGVPFCQVHCPLHNNIPDWLKLTAEGRLEEAYELSLGDQHLARDLRPDLPAGPAVRRQLRHRAVGPRHGHHRRGREVHHRHRLGAGLGPAVRPRARAAGSPSASSAPARPGWRRRSSCAGGLPGPRLRPLRPGRRADDLRHPRLQAGEGRRRCAAREQLRGRRHPLPPRLRRRPRRRASPSCASGTTRC